MKNEKVRDAEAYQQMLDAVERSGANEGIRKGLAALDSGKSKRARVVISAIKARRTIRSLRSATRRRSATARCCRLEASAT